LPAARRIFAVSRCLAAIVAAHGSASSAATRAGTVSTVKARGSRSAVSAFQEKAYSFAFYRPEESGVGAFPLLKSCQQVAQIVVTQNPDAIITRQCALTP